MDLQVQNVLLHGSDQELSQNICIDNNWENTVAY